MASQQPRSPSPSRDVERGQHSDTDSSSAREVDAEKHSVEDTPPSPTDDSDIETERGGPAHLSQHPTKEDHPDGNGSILSRVASRVLTRPSTKSSWNPGPPPDGGLQAWLAVASTHIVVMNTWGVINSFGLFQSHYTTALHRTPSDVSWIGSLQIFLLFFVGALTGRLTDAGYFRHVFALGIVFQIVGIFTASVATQYWQVVLAQGICMGLGNGCLFCPCISTLSTYFSKKRSLAIGMAACGSATGGLVFPSMVRQLAPVQGFPAAMRAIGYVQIATFVVALLGLKQRIPPRRSGRWVEWGAFREGEYTLYAMGSFSCFLGLYFGFYYIASFSRDIIGMSYTDSLNLLLVMNGAGISGRLIPNHIADRAGTINVFIPTAGIAGLCVLGWIAVKNTAGTYVWAVFYGMAAGGIQSLFPAGLSGLTTDLRKAGVRMGMVFTIVSFATLAGPPIAGAIITASDGKYYGAQAFAGATLLLGMGLMTAARWVKVRRILREQNETGYGWHVKV